MTDIGIIDVHSHMLFPCYLEGLKEMGIETSILSLSTPHIHHGDSELAVRLARRINEASAALSRQYPDR